MATADAPLDPTDPFQRVAQTFPQLGEDMVERIRHYGREERLAPGTPIYARGDRNCDFFLVLDGAIEVYEHGDDDTVRVFTTHRDRQFTGELTLFNEREILVNGRAGAEPTRIVRVRRADFRRMLQSEPDIAEIVMRAYILRRVGLIRHSQGGAVLVGPGHSADTLRLQHFRRATAIRCASSTPSRTRKRTASSSACRSAATSFRRSCCPSIVCCATRRC
jgi:thioredoxin reductase (NADPH)